LLIVAPWASLACDREGTDTLDNAVIAVNIAIQAAGFAVGDDIDASTLLIEDGNVGRVIEQLFEIIGAPCALLIQIFTGMPPPGLAV
jgi:hypothetical protein